MGLFGPFLPSGGPRMPDPGGVRAAASCLAMRSPAVDALEYEVVGDG